MNPNTHRIYTLFKYVVYALLTFNIYVFFMEEWAAAAHRFTGAIALADIVQGFAATIDTASWVVLLLLFELETSVLADHHFTGRVTFALHFLRALCYAVIIYAFYGYLTKLFYLSGMAVVPQITDLCALVGEWAYTIDLDEYELITAANCAGFATGSIFYQLPGIDALVDAAGRLDILGLAWVDVINAGVWLLIVLVLEIDVRLQDRNLLQGTALKISNYSKYVFYSLLVLALVYWSLNGDFVDSWDSFLWLVAFVFIEMNVFAWRRESQQTATTPVD